MIVIHDMKTLPRLARAALSERMRVDAGENFTLELNLILLKSL
jgi:hypothetical protein